MVIFFKIFLLNIWTFFLPKVTGGYEEALEDTRRKLLERSYDETITDSEMDPEKKRRRQLIDFPWVVNMVVNTANGAWSNLVKCDRLGTWIWPRYWPQQRGGGRDDGNIVSLSSVSGNSDDADVTWINYNNINPNCVRMQQMLSCRLLMHELFCPGMFPQSSYLTCFDEDTVNQTLMEEIEYVSDPSHCQPTLWYPRWARDAAQMNATITPLDAPSGSVFNTTSNPCGCTCEQNRSLAYIVQSLINQSICNASQFHQSICDMMLCTHITDQNSTNGTCNY